MKIYLHWNKIFLYRRDRGIRHGSIIRLYRDTHARQEFLLFSTWWILSQLFLARKGSIKPALFLGFFTLWISKTEKNYFFEEQLKMLKCCSAALALCGFKVTSLEERVEDLEDEIEELKLDLKDAKMMIHDLQAQIPVRTIQPKKAKASQGWASAGLLNAANDAWWFHQILSPAICRNCLSFLIFCRRALFRATNYIWSNFDHFVTCSLIFLSRKSHRIVDCFPDPYHLQFFKSSFSFEFLKKSKVF